MEQTFCFVPDTNVWRSRRFVLMRSAQAEAVLYALQRKKGRIGLPEVIELELAKQISELGMETARRAIDAHDLLGEITGTQPVIGPSFDAESFQTAVDARLDELRELLVRVPFTLEHAKRSLVRINAELPPNGRHNQQFKDSAIWEALLELGRSHDVHFITADNGFFENRDRRQGLARVLLDECKRTDATITVWHLEEVDELLLQLQEGVPALEDDAIADLIEAELLARPDLFLSERPSGAGRPTDRFIGLFRTRSASTLSVGFRFTYSLPEDSDSFGLRSLTVHGYCSYALETGSVADIHITSEELSRQPGGEFVEPFRARYLRHALG